jgi:hypothetical protein
MYRRGAAFYAAHMQITRIEVYLVPPQINEFGSAKPVTVGHENHGGIAMAPTIVALCGFHERLDFGLGKVLSRSDFSIPKSARRDCSVFDVRENQFEV